MRTKETLRVEIRVLMTEMARNGLLLGMAKNPTRMIELSHARTEILLSIAHRQGLLIEILSNEIEYSTGRKVA